MKAVIYARVSTERQAERGTSGSQVEALRAHVAAAADELAGEYCDDGHSGARLDRPGLEEMRDAAEAGLFEVVWCLSPDRLARSYAYQVLILDELARLGVSVRFTDSPGLDEHDPQAKLLTQVQGVIAEYERAKIGERYRRGKLFRARAGEVISWKAPYGYRRIPRGPAGPAHLEIFEPEAAVVRRIFAERAAGTTIRQICRLLNADAVPTPTGSRAVWGTSTLDRILRNEAYIGRTYFNRTEAVPDRRPGHHARQVPRPRADWIAISCPAIIADETFEAAGKVSTDNTKWSPRRAEPGAWLLRGLVKCGPCGVGTSCHKMRGRNGTWHRYYYCHNHDPLRAGGHDRRCPERNIRADALDEFVFAQVRAALLDPALLLAGEQAIAVHAPVPDDQLLAAELTRLDRKLDAARGEHQRLIDLYQAGLIDMPELQRRAAAITARQRELSDKRTSLAAERADLARGNRLRHGVKSFATRVHAVIDQLDPAQRQELLRLLIEDVQVTGWHVKIRLRIPLDNPPHGDHTHRRTWDCNFNGVTPEMEETPVTDVTTQQGQDGPELSAADEQLLHELTERARAGGLKLTGEGGLLGKLTKMVIEGALEGELDDHLGYGKHDPAGRDGSNSRNGHRGKTVLTDTGPVEISVPRDRDASFEPKIVAKRQRRLTGVDEMVISLSAKGLTHGEIAAHLAEVYGAEVSKQTITAITDRVMEGLADWQSRPLDSVYAVIFIDAINVKIREGQVANRPIYLALGVTVDGERDVLGLWAGEHGDGEGAKYWMRVCSEIKNRGTRDVLMVVCDGLKGLPDAVNAVWEKTIVQTCIVHYPDTVVMPIPAGPVLVGGGERLRDIGIIEQVAA